MREREILEKNYRPQYVYSDYNLVDEETGLRLIKEHMDSSEYKNFVKENNGLFADGFLLGTDRGGSKRKTSYDTEKIVKDAIAAGADIKGVIDKLMAAKDSMSPARREDFYNPFDKPNILNDFERLDFDPRLDELGFVRTYGMLGFSKKRDLKAILNKIEPLAWFRHKQEQYHTMVDIYACISGEPRPNLIRTHLEYLKENAASFSLDHYSQDYWAANLKNDRNQLLTLSRLFAIMLDQRLQLSHPTLWITDTSNPSKFTWGYTSNTLIDDIYLMFWREITKQTELKECPSCHGKFFALKQGKGRPHAYHTKACSTAHRQRGLNERLRNKEVKGG